MRKHKQGEQYPKQYPIKQIPLYKRGIQYKATKEYLGKKETIYNKSTKLTTPYNKAREHVVNSRPASGLAFILGGFLHHFLPVISSPSCLIYANNVLLFSIMK